MAEDVLIHLQSLLLSTALQGTPLPGIDWSLDFPDLVAVRGAPEVRLSTENLAAPDELAAIVTIIAPDEVARIAAREGPFAYLRFLAPERHDGRIGLTIQLVTGFDDVEPLPLGGIVANFASDEAGRWRAVEPTAAMAY